MAGRPVAARGGNGMLYGLIAFVIVAVVSLGGFVWQLTGNKRLQSEKDSASRRLKQYGTPPAYYVEEADARASDVFAAMSKDIEDLAFLITGKKEAVRPAIVEGANKLLRQIAETSPDTINAGDTLLTALKNLHGRYKDLKNRYAQLSTDLEDLRLERHALEEGVKVARDEFEQQVAELQEEVERIGRQKTEQLAAKDEQVANQQAEAEAIGEELSRLKVLERQREDSYEIDVNKLKLQINDLRSKIQELRPGGFDPYDILTKADGRVLRAIPGSDVVYINLGEKDRIRPGMTFEVFSPTAGRRGGFRGKASVEVTAAMEITAECRVTRTVPERPIVEGDVVVNIAYERNRLPKFVVRGEFDLNYDGQADINGAENVTAIIRGWGGQVVDEIDETTDFLVVGTGPYVPAFPTDRPVSDVIRNLADSRLDELDDYRRDVERARTLYIPVITQSQFLLLTGDVGQASMLAE